MKSLILCEGKTDAILISYLLCKQWGWQYVKNKNRFKNFNISVSEKENESAEWYENGDRELLICGVGGCTKFKSFFEDKIYPFQKLSETRVVFQKIIVVVDHDQNTIDGLEYEFSNSFKDIITNMKNNIWIDNSYLLDGFNTKVNIKGLLLIVPNQEEGALETVLLNSISDDIYDKKIVDNVNGFVEEIKDDADKYLFNKRMVLKAKLGVVFAIMSPQKVFSFIDEILNSVDWERSSSLMNLFKEFANI